MPRHDSPPSIETILQLQAAELHRKRQGEVEAATRSARRRFLLLKAGFSLVDARKAAADPQGISLDADLSARVAAYLTSALAGQRRFARRRDTRYDLSLHIALADWNRTLFGEGPRPEPADPSRLPGRVANRTGPRRSVRPARTKGVPSGERCTDVSGANA